MIVKHQSNLKVHFAGMESHTIFCSALAGGVKYILFTVLPLISEKFGIPPISYSRELTNTAQTRFENSKHCIMDSGLFSLMFGLHKDMKKEPGFIDKWYEELAAYTLSKGYKGTVVEVDCQKIYGVEKAWELRERMRADLPNRIINVFHKEDGQYGLDRLIEFTDYIAISVPELRVLGQKNYLYDIAHYIKNKKPSIDIHLLGCTEQKDLQALKFCSSSDSTSYQTATRFGNLKVHGLKSVHVSRLKPEVRMQYDEKVKYWLEKLNIKGHKGHYQSVLAFQVSEMIKIYEQLAGPQD